MQRRASDPLPDERHRPAVIGTVLAAERRPALSVASGIVLGFLLVLVQAMNPGVSDVSWLIVTASKMLDGAGLYTDILEVNPPASVLIYVPPVLAERHLGIRAENAVLLQVLFCLGLAVLGARRLLMRHDLLPNRGAAGLAALLAFGVLAGNAFGQREHFALLAMLPVLALAACRARRRVRVSKAELLLIGLAAGAAVVIKPHFGLPILLAQGYAAFRRRMLRPLFNTENVVIAGVVLAYWAAVLRLFPDFWSNVFPLAGVYRDARLATGTLLILISPYLVPAFVYWWTSGRRRPSETTGAALFASIGFFLAYLEQGKGWNYHQYPGVALLTFAVTSDMARRYLETRCWGPPMRLTAGVLLVASASIRLFPLPHPSAALEPAIMTVRERPTVLAITGDLGLGHPLTRRVNGIWVGTAPSQWITETATVVLEKHEVSPERRETLEGLIALDRDILAGDIARSAPDVILVDENSHWVDWKAWAAADDLLCKLLSAYTLLQTSEEVAVYIRRDLVAGRVRNGDGAAGTGDSSWRCVPG